MPNPKSVAAFFAPQSHISKVESFGKGLINNSWVIHCNQSTPGKIFLQQMNNHVFSNPEHIINNLQVLHKHIATLPLPQPDSRTLQFPKLIKTHQGASFHVDNDGKYWRAFQFIENTQTLNSVQTLQQAREIGYVVGRFHALLSNVEPNQLQTTLPNFHETPNYLQQFEVTFQKSKHSHHSNEIQQCLAYIKRFRDSVFTLEQAKQNNQIPIRLIHGDPKRDNILFDHNAQFAISLVDLDTMQPGLIHYDIGDCLRSCCGIIDDNDPQQSRMFFDLDIFEAILESYLEQAHKIITPNEYNWFYDAIMLIPFELGLRFLTDYLNGNIYFKIDHPQQNLLKALQQFNLVNDIESKKMRIQSVIKKLQKI